MFFGRRGLGNRFFESSAARLSAWAHDKAVEAQEERGSVGSDFALQTQYYSHKYSIEGAEKPMSGVHPVAQRL